MMMRTKLFACISNISQIISLPQMSPCRSLQIMYFRIYFIVKSYGCLKYNYRHMQPTRYSDQPTEDLAISSLLEIDLREQESLGNWQDTHPNTRATTHKRTLSFHKQHPHPNGKYHQRPMNETQSNFRGQSSNFHLTMLKELSHDSASPTFIEQTTSPNNKLPSTPFNQGEYWSSRVNWMSDSNPREYSSQPKLNKKFSFGYEVNGRRSSRKEERGSLDEKTRQSQYKTNLIYSLLTNKDVFKDRGDAQYKSRSGALPPATTNRGKISISRRNPKCQGGTNEVGKMNSQVQQYMRETLKRLYLKNRNEDQSSNHIRQSEQSSMIREMLINIENIKEGHTKDSMQNRECLDYSKENGEELQMMARAPQRKLHHQIHHSRHILDLNEQAEKVYTSKAIHHISRQPIKAQ